MAIEKIEVAKDSNNKMLKRRELMLEVEFDGSTPSREEIKKEAARQLNLKPEHIVIVRAEQQYGKNMTKVLIHEYHDAEALKIAQKHMLARPNKKKSAAGPTGSAKAEAPKEEKKAEESKKE